MAQNDAGGKRALATLALLLALSCVGPEDVRFDDPAGALVDARRMIEERRLDPEAHEGWLEPEELPRSLRIPDLNYVMVHQDHVDLVIARDPDTELGARIWSPDAQREHADEPTAYAEIFFYRFFEDLPEAPDNIF